MIDSQSLSPAGSRRVVLLVCAVLIPLAVIWDLTQSASPERLVQIIIDVGIGAIAVVELRNHARTHIFTQVTAVAYAALSITDSINGTTISRFDNGATLALLVLLGVIHIATRPASRKSTVFIVLLTAAWAVTVVIVGDADSSRDVGLLLLAIPGQIIVIWLVRQLIQSLAKTSEMEATHARVQTALAGCSQALLKRGSEHPLTDALIALLGATEAEYAYVDVNRTHPEGHTTWEIVAEANNARYPDWESSFVSGDYLGIESTESKMRDGLPATIIVADLDGPIREKYEAEGVIAELMAPIRIGDRWVGTIGYTDYTRPGTWTEVEIEGLMRAAEMVSAYWEREAAREGLMELAQAKDRFIASVSHELRTPLAAVVGFSDELKKRAGDFTATELEEIAALIFAQSMEVAQLVDDLLTAERATTGNLTIKPDDISLLHECREIVQWTQADQQVVVKGEDVIARADALRTRQVIRNLFTNANKYGGEIIELEVSRRDDIAVVTVRDNGGGVRTGDVERIFDAYYRAQENLTKPDSVGLGLAVARQLARLMDGDVVYKRSQGWTAFEFTLPLISDPARQDKTPVLLPQS